MIIYTGEVITLAESYLKHATNRDNNQMQTNMEGKSDLPMPKRKTLHIAHEWMLILSSWDIFSKESWNQMHNSLFNFIHI